MRKPEEILTAMREDVPTSEYLPLGGHVTDKIIQLKYSQDYLAIWRLSGITFETTDAIDLELRKEGLNNLWRNLGSDYAVWSYRIRRQVKERLSGEYENSFCSNFNQRYMESLDNHKQMRTEIFLALIYKPASQLFSGMAKRMVASKESLAQQQEQALTTLEDTAKLVEGLLEKYEPVRLGCRERNNVTFTDMGSFLGLLANGVWEDVPLQRGQVANWLPNSRVFFGDGNGMAEFRHVSGRKRYAGFMDIQEYPTRSKPGMTNEVMRGSFDFIEAQSFTMLGKRKAVDALKQQKGHLLSSGEASQTELDDIDLALDLVRDGNLALGEYHFTMCVLGESLLEVADNLAAARKSYEEGAGYRMSLLDAVPEGGWLSMFPGTWKFRPREAKITSKNFAGFACFHNFASGKRNGNPWGEAISLLRTPSGQPYYFNFHVSPEGRDSTDEKLPGNTFICGSTGVGKTTTVNSLLAMATKIPGIRMCLYDKDRGLELFVRAIGGRYFALRRGLPTGFNPFKMEPTQRNILFLEKLVGVCARGEEGAPLTESERMEISHAVRTVMSPQVSPALKRLSGVYQNLRNTGGNDLRQRLMRWTQPNQLGWVFDNDEDVLDLKTGSIFGFDYTEFLADSEISSPIIMYLLHQQEELLNGDPFIMGVEEFWMPARNPIVADMFLDIDKTIRKKNGLRIYLTQSPGDAVGLPIGKTLVEQSNTCIYLPNPRADRDDYVNGFKVTAEEFEIIRTFGETSRQFLIKQGHKSAIVQLDLSNMPDLINILSGSTDNVELFDQICEASPGIEVFPEKWMPLLQDKIVERRSRMIRQREQ